MPIPFNLTRLLTSRPSPSVRPWTRDENAVVESLLICLNHVEFGDWGTDEDYELLKPLFDANDNYLG